MGRGMDGSALGRRRFLALGAGAGLAAAAGLTGCSDGPQLRDGGTLLVGLPAYPALLNPAQGTSEEARWVADPVVEALYGYRNDTTLQPVLAAADPQVSADGLVWTIRLRDGVRFADGEPFTAEHVAACLNRVGRAEAAGEWAPYLGGRIAAAGAVDAGTVRIELPRPFGVLREFLACLPIPHQASLDDPQALVGTGPFQVERITAGESVRLRRNDAYRGDKAPYDALEFRVVADAGARAAALRSGALLVDPRLAATQVKALRKASGLQAHAVSAPVDLTTALNMRRAPFDNVAVRRALAAAMDRKAVRDGVYQGLAVLGQGPIGPATEGWTEIAVATSPAPTATLTAAPAVRPFGDTVDPDRVRVLLGESGVSGPLRFTVLATDEVRAVAEALAAGWTKYGFAPVVETADAATWRQRRASGDFDFALSVRRPAYAVGITAFDVLAPAASDHPDNTGYRNPELDRLLAEAWATGDASRRVKLCTLADGILLRDAVMMPPVYPKSTVGQSRKVESIDEDRMGLGRLDLASLHRRG